MNELVQRYTWEDAVIEAESLGLLPAGAVNLCLRLARAINWVPADGRPSGLYWKNETALKSVNSSKATYHRYRQQLFDAGFFVEVKGNLLPQIPELSQIETVESQIETTESQLDSPYSEDTYSEDLLSETIREGLTMKHFEEQVGTPLIVETTDFSNSVGKTPQSQIETRLTRAELAERVELERLQRRQRKTPVLPGDEDLW